MRLNLTDTMLDAVSEMLNPRIISNLYKDVQDVKQNTSGFEVIDELKKMYCHHLLVCQFLVFFILLCCLVTSLVNHLDTSSTFLSYLIAHLIGAAG